MTDPIPNCRNARHVAIQGIRKYLKRAKPTASDLKVALAGANNYFNMVKDASSKADRAVRAATKRCEKNPDKLDACLQILADKAQAALDLAIYRKDTLVMLRAFKSTNELRHYIHVEDYIPPSNSSWRPAPSGAMI